ncbi:MAG TPA: hypothetical protein VJB96_03025, partial [Patescibacteria group bacterium]|nr:hypothetical protein [Patescibacteria group bacterium]
MRRKMHPLSLLNLLVVGALLAWVFRQWFTGSEIIGGDWPYFFPETLKVFTLYPSLWVPWLGNGVGGVNLLLGLNLFQTILIVPFTQWLGIPWPIVYKIGWFGLFLLLGSFSFWKLIRSVLPNDAKMFWPISIFIYVINSYALMLVSGGQMGVALSYAVAPLVLASFIDFQKNDVSPQKNVKFQISNVKSIILAGLILAFQVMIDLRIAYVTMVAVMIYFGVTRKNIITVGISVGVALLLNAFWLLPQVLLKTNPVAELGAAYTSAESVKFFSFADFSHALSLLHPNWPENIFGKTYFLQPEFLVIALFAFAAFLWKSDVKIRLFGILALVGVFFAKGAHEPFGFIYLWLFEHVPGFVMFRDPTKWLLLVILSYSILIPFTLEKAKKYGTIVSVAFVLFWIALHRQAFLGQLPGTFVQRTVPPVYESYKTFIAYQPGFFRTLWVPRQSRFTFATATLPALEAEPLFGATDSATLALALSNPKTQSQLEEYGVAYVIVPFDALGELFVMDRQYDERKRLSYKNVLDAVPWLTKIRDDELAMYKTRRHNDLFWSDGGEVQYESKNGSEYVVRPPGQSQLLYFSQRFHPRWRMLTDKGEIILPREYGNLMVFRVPEDTPVVTIF